MRLAIVRPKETATKQTKSLFQTIVPGSVVVAQPNEAGATRVYYEGGIYSRKQTDGTYQMPSDEDRRQYAMSAAGRLENRYPTTAFFVMFWDNAYDELEEIGYVDGRDVKFFGE